jgi:phage I-like protein
MVVMTRSDLTKPKRRQMPMHDSTLDLFDDKAAQEADAFAMMLEAAAAALEVTVDYYIEEFMTDEF